MIFYTKYAEDKFDILNRHKVYFTYSDVEEAIKNPAQAGRFGNYLFAQKNNIKTVYKKEGGVIKIITFYPIKNEL